MQTVYEAAGGAEGLLRLAKEWHARVMADEIVDCSDELGGGGKRYEEEHQQHDLRVTLEAH